MADQIMAADKTQLKGVLSKPDMLTVENAILIHWDCRNKAVFPHLNLLFLKIFLAVNSAA
jgi:hypothetical protein